MNLTRQSWPLGWCPHIDKRNGTPEGLIRADNLGLNEFGVLSLVNSAQKINQTPVGAPIRQIFSKTIHTTKHRYLALSNGRVIKSSDDFENTTELVGGENFLHVGFASILGQNLICAGNTKLKDDGVTVRQLGLKRPDAAPIKIDTPVNVLDLNGSFSDWELEYGESFSDSHPAWEMFGIYTTPSASDAWGAVTRYYTPGGINLLSIGGNPGADDDTFSIFVSGTDGKTYTHVKMEFYLNSTYPAIDTYYYEWENVDRSFEILATETGYTGGITLSVARKDFTRTGTDPNLDWSNVKVVKISFRQGASGIGYFSNLKITGKFLVGNSYEYASMNIANLGSYIAKSPLSTPSTILYPTGGVIKLQLNNPLSGEDADTQINEIWVFRRSSIRSDIRSIGSTPVLDDWYRVAVCEFLTAGLEIEDTVTDIEALELNIKANQYLISLKDIEEEIIGIVGGYYDRVLYLTRHIVYVSEILNPDSVDSRNTIKLEGGDVSENLWITKTSLGVVLIGTTQDIFEISGTFINLPDGSIDLYVKPLSVTYPPLSYDFDVFSNEVYYPAKDGIRTLAPGGESRLITSPQLDPLFRGEERHGVSNFRITSKHMDYYPIAVTQSWIFISLQQEDGERNVIAFDRTTNTWQYRWINPRSFCVEEDGTILAGFEDEYLREYNKGKLIDGSSGQTIRFKTVFDHNQQPRNRKDYFTLKINADTGNQPVSIWATVDGHEEIDLGEHSFDGLQEVFIKLENVVQTGKSIQLHIEGYWLERFYLYNFTIEYDAFPEQLNFLRIPNNNLGTYSRKRLTNYAFVINTLGNTVIFTPIVDGTGLTTSDVNLNRKGTFVHYFNSETTGTDVGGTLDGGPFEYYNLNLEEIVSEKLPVPVKYLIIPATDYGEPNRKRHSSYKFQIDTRGYDVQFTPKLDGVAQTPLTVNTIEKRTVEYFFTTDTIAVDIGGILQTLANEEFEFYGVVKPQQLELLPPRLRFFLIPPNDYGNPNRKRHSSYKFQINTFGSAGLFTPIIDGVEKTPIDFSTPSKKTVEYFFTEDTIGIDIGGKIEIEAPEEFEFYGVVVPQEIEVLPPRLKYFLIPPNDYGIPNRKRHSSYKFQINTNGQNVIFTPIIDGAVHASQSLFLTQGKQTVEHFLLSDTIGIDIGGTLQAASTTPFEFYGVVKPQEIEVLPPRLRYFLIPPNDYGQPNRKRHSSYKFQINTNGGNVRFTPILDTVAKPPLTINTASKQTVEYFFTLDTIGIDAGGILESLGAEEFEFYGVIKPQEVEVLPSRLKEFRIPENNYGIAARKRIRTMPLEINTNGFNVTFTPYIDGVDFPSSIFSSSSRKTLLHYFESDVFGIDFWGELVGIEPFEFYGLLKPEDVEVLPVAKKLDQIGPLRFDKIAKLLACRLRIITQGQEQLALNFYDEDGLNLSTIIHTETILTHPNQDEIYEFAFPKTIKGSTIRITIGPALSPFHRYDLQLKVNLSGMQADPKWVKVK